MTTPSFRFPGFIPADAAHPQVLDALRSHDNSITDLNQAIASLKGQMTTQAASVAAVATSAPSNTTTSSETIVQNMVSGGPVNNQTGVTIYTTSQMDNGALVVFSSSSAVAVTLNFSVTTPWYFFAVNEGTGAVTLTPQQGRVDGAASQTIGKASFSIVFFDGANFFSCVLPSSISSFVAVSHQFLTSFSATTGMFAAAQPAFSDISGQIATSQIPGISATITTAKLTTGGTNGSQVFTNGILTAQTPAT